MDWTGQKRLLPGAMAVLVVVAVLVAYSTAQRPRPGLASVSGGLHGTYATDFPRAENPISDNGMWLNGRADGLEWCDIRTTPGLAFGTQSGTIKYDDSVAVLSGTWGPDQAAEARVRTIKQDDRIYEEVELLLRCSLSAHRSTGYEINFRCSRTRNAYAQIVRWNGPGAKFTYLANASGARFGVSNGDLIRATIRGNVITAYKNGTPILTAVDNTFAGGNPGMGFYLEGATGLNANYGFTSFVATDGAFANSGSRSSWNAPPFRIDPPAADFADQHQNTVHL